MTRYDQYRSYANDMKMTEVIEIYKRIEQVEGNETEQNVEEILKMIEQTNMPEAMRKVLLCKYRVLYKRLNTTVPSYFGQRVKEYRRNRGLSITKAAKMSNQKISVSFWSRIENGKRKKCSTDTIQAMADVLQVPMTELLGIAAEVEKEKNPIALPHLILGNRLTVDDIELSLEQKKMMVELLKVIHQSKWTSDTKHLNTIDIINAIEQYKNLEKLSS